ncbi:MAG: hypothetical protein ACI4RT_01870 [Candidatus Spyradenecus sp.]
MKQCLCVIGVALGLRGGLWLLPEAWVVRGLCAVPAWGAAWWHGGVPGANLSFCVGAHTFTMTRACAAESFTALLAAIVLVRRWRWLWAVWPAALCFNTLRVVTTTTLALHLPVEFAYERLVHETAGLIWFLCALILAWMLTERKELDDGAA